MERYRTTIILVVVLLALGGLAFLLNNRAGTGGTDTGTTPEAARYVWQESATVQEVEVVSGTQRVAVRQQGDTGIWDVIEPVQEPADSFAVRGVADTLASLQATDVITESGNLADFNLDEPQLTVTAVFSGTTPITRTLHIGGPTFDGSGYYVKTPDDPTVYVVSNAIIEPLRSWPSSPPKQQPTPTPLPVTLVPVSPVVTDTVTTTLTPELSPVPATPGAEITATVTITGTSPITSTSPGAANPTTPLASPAPAEPTGTP